MGCIFIWLPSYLYDIILYEHLFLSEYLEYTLYSEFSTIFPTVYNLAGSLKWLSEGLVDSASDFQPNGVNYLLYIYALIIVLSLLSSTLR